MMRESRLPLRCPEEFIHAGDISKCCSVVNTALKALDRDCAPKSFA